MSGNKDIEARLHRALQNQIRVPKLGKAFDAAVWARIEEQEAKATNPGAPRALRASRWLAVSNFVGIAVTLTVASYFALDSFRGIDPPAVDLGVRVTMPVISDEMLTRTLASLGQVLGGVALLFGLSFTALGRRLRASFS